MQVHEFHRYESHFYRECFDGRWQWEKVDYEFKEDDKCLTGIKWIDLFGKYSTVEFKLKSPVKVWHIAPLTLDFLFLSCDESNDDGEGIRIAYLDWSTKQATVSDHPFFTDIPFCPISDSSGVSNEHLDFLLYNETAEPLDCAHCRLNIKELKVEQVGERIQLPKDKFNCVNLNNNGISGLSDSLNTITRFDLLRRCNLMEITVNGLPSSLFSSYAYLRNTVETSAWTNDGRLILRKSNDRNAKSIIYVVDVETGNTTQLPYNFDGYICQMSLGSGGHLYICASQWLTKKAPMLIGHNVMDSKPSNLRVYRTFRVPLSQPESLSFLAAASIPQTIPLNIQQLLKRRDDIPIQFYKIDSVNNLLDHSL